MTVYYLVYDSLGLALERIGNFRSDNKTLNDNLANGVEYLVKRVPNELLDSSSACILEFTEVKPRVIQNTQASADAKAARVLEEFEKGVLPSVQRVKLKAETHPTDRAIAEWIVSEKTKHASIVSRAYDTGEAGSLEKYTDEVQSIVRMTLDILLVCGPPKEYTVASAEEAIVKTAFDFLEEQLLNPENAAYSAEEIRDMLGRALPDSLRKSKRDIEDNVMVKPVVNSDMITDLFAEVGGADLFKTIEEKPTKMDDLRDNVIKTPIERKILHYTCERCGSKKDLTWLEGAEIRNYIPCDLCKNIWEYNHWMKKDDVPGDKD